MLMVLALACGDDGGGDTDQESVPLGQRCSDAATCEPGRCAVLPVIGGSTTQGYCTPVCTDGDDSTCFDDGGNAVCLQGTCQFPCQVSDDCPDGLDCLITGGPVNVCAVPG